MATRLHRIKGEQFFDDNGAPLGSGKLYFFEAGTTNLQDTFADAAGMTPNSNPVDLTSSGRLPSSVYFGDSDSYSDYKELLTEGGDPGDDYTQEVTVTPWPVDNLPAATPADSSAAFAPPLYAWTQVTNADSPVALTAADAGKAYEADSTSGDIEFDLPSAASAGNGKPFIFKKMVSANSMTIDQSGSETIDNSAAALTITRQYQVVEIASNGAEWYVVRQYLETVPLERLPAGYAFVIDRAYATYASNADLSTVIPHDDTIPQSNEGTEIVTAAITPKSASSRIRVTFTGQAHGDGTVSGGGSSRQSAIAALFQDSGTDAIAATACTINEQGGTSSDIEIGFANNLVLVFEHSPATTSEVTYKIRVGPGAGTMRMNGTTAARRLGGVSVATLVLEEISQ